MAKETYANDSNALHEANGRDLNELAIKYEFNLYVAENVPQTNAIDLLR